MQSFNTRVILLLCLPLLTTSSHAQRGAVQRGDGIDTWFPRALENLEQHLTFDGATVTPTTVLDSAAPPCNGTAAGTVTQTPSGVIGDALQVGGQSHGGVDFGDVLDPGQSGYTASLWFKATALGGFLTSKGNRTSGDAGWCIFMTPAGDLRVRANAGGRADQRFGQQLPQDASSISDGHWYHVALVIERDRGADRTRIRGYLNGSNTGWRPGGGGTTEDHVADAVISIDTNSPLKLGPPDHDSSGFYGCIDEFTIWSRALNADEVAAIYRAGWAELRHKAGETATTPRRRATDIRQDDVFVSGSGDYHTYRIPALITAADGSLLAFCEGRKRGRGDSGDIDLLMKRSTDGGVTWSTLQMVWDDDENVCGNPCPVVDQQTGRIHLLMTWNHGADREQGIRAGTSKDTRRVFICHSDNHGLTWSRPRDITHQAKSDDWRWYATGPGVAIQLQHGKHRGRLVVPCNHTSPEYGRASHVIYSDDAGQSWTISAAVKPECNESQVVELPDGRLMLNMRSYAGKGCRAIATSTDGGATWSSVTYDPTLISPVCQASIIGWPSDADAPKATLLFSNPAQAERGRRRTMTVRMSTDGGVSWPYALLLHDGPAAYSCLAVLPDRTIGCLYERGEGSPYERITLARLSREQLLASEASPASAAGLAQSDLSAFLGTPHFHVQQLYGMGKEHERGGRNIVVAQDGAILAFDGPQVRRSIDGGDTWEAAIEIGPEANGCNALVDEITGAIMLIHPDGHRLLSVDSGLTWQPALIDVHPNLMGHGSSEDKDLDAACMQPGITLMFGAHKGRLLSPARWIPSNALPWRPYIYNTAIYSDDRGKTWQTTTPFPVLGTGEAALAELSDGRILYSSREHMSRGNRFFAWSYDGGARWLNFWRSEVLPDGARGTSYGCMSGLVRLPIQGHDVLVYSNLDTAAGMMPSLDEAGASRAQGRERITVWASFDGGHTWPVKRLVFDGPSAYSNLAAGRPNTPSEGRIFLSFEGGAAGMYSGVQVATFNLAWLLDGERTGNGEIPERLAN